MRIIILTILFISGLLYFSSEKTLIPQKSTQLDSVKIKAAAPDREQRLLTASKKDEKQEHKAVKNKSGASREVSAVEEEEDYTDYSRDYPEDAHEVSIVDLDQGWSDELRNILGRLEPMDADTIQKAYQAEIENYRADMEALLNESQKQDPQADSIDSDQMMSILDQRHEQNLREIFGAHYDAVRDHYQNFMQSGNEY